MKLIEKLAMDYSDLSDNEYAVQEAYIAGFRKAREIVMIEMYKDGLYRLQIFDRVKEIGEEEV